MRFNLDVPMKTSQASVLSPTAITLAWFVRLRWGAVLGQTFTIAVAVLVLQLDVSPVALGLLVLLTAISNAALAAWLKRRQDCSPHTLGFLFAADTLVLSGLLYFSGGPSNPFSVLYLVHVTLGALVLGMRWSLGIVVLSALSYAALFFWHEPVAALQHAHHNGSAFSIHLQGMWVAFTIAASLIAYFVTRVARALRERDEELAQIRALAERTEKLASLSTLAAGAAHELGTPLGTIAVISKDLEQMVRERPEEALEDVRLIRGEVHRCREIVQRMCAHAGETMGELPQATNTHEVFERCMARLGEQARAKVRVASERAWPVTSPIEGLTQILSSLVQNALYASQGVDAAVFLSSEGDAAGIRLIVEDQGCGIPSEVLARIGEPFFSTKPPGDGMGLGVFLARSFAERWGGRLDIESRPGSGTRVVLALPLAPTTVSHG